MLTISGIESIVAHRVPDVGHRGTRGHLQAQKASKTNAAFLKLAIEEVRSFVLTTDLIAQPPEVSQLQRGPCCATRCGQCRNDELTLQCLSWIRLGWRFEWRRVPCLEFLRSGAGSPAAIFHSCRPCKTTNGWTTGIRPREVLLKCHPLYRPPLFLPHRLFLP